jgi:dienelactone hydrolase
MRPRRRLTALLLVCVAALGGVYLAAPYARAASLVVRAADFGGRVEALANEHAHAVTIAPRHTLPTRSGDVPAQFYVPDTTAERTIVLMPGIHSMGIDEPRLTALARELAATGVRVMTLALPDLERYRITPRSTDVIEDAVTWVAGQPALAPDGRVGVVGISFAGGLAIAAAGRPAIRERIAFVVSFGGHGHLGRVMRYLLTGDAPHVEGIATHPPHDYGVAVVLYGLAGRGVVPDDQVEALRDGVHTFLLASQLTLVDTEEADAMFRRARQMADALPEPSRTFMQHVNDRAVDELGPLLLPFLDGLATDDPALSAELAPPPAAPIYLLHGDGDTVIPTAESAVLGEHLRREGVNVHVLLSGLITHAEANRAAAAAETWRLVRFWASVLRR